MELTVEQLKKEKKLVNDRLEDAINVFYTQGTSDEVSAYLRTSLMHAYIYNLCCSVPISLRNAKLCYGIFRMDRTRYAYIACSLAEGPEGYPGESTIFIPWRDFFKYVIADQECEGLMINSARRSPQGAIIIMSRPVLQYITDVAEKNISDLPDNVRDEVIKGL